MRSIGSLLLVGSVLLSACSSTPDDDVDHDDDIVQDEAAVAGVGNTYPFCKSKSYLSVNPCGFKETAALKYDRAFKSENY